MKLSQLMHDLGLRDLTPELSDRDADVTAGYASDLLSDVLANAPEAGVLVTVQVHLNVVAVAVHAELACVVFASNRQPDEAVRAKAVSERVRLFASSLPAFELIGRLYGLGVKGA